MKKGLLKLAMGAMSILSFGSMRQYKRDSGQLRN